MDEKRYCVYTHTNKINNKIYVGMTSLKPEQRWNKGQGYSQQPKFYQDIEKYGWDNFIHKIEFENLTKKEAQKKEIELIEKYNTRDETFGYNSNCAHFNSMGNYTYEYHIDPEYEKHIGKEKLYYCIELDKAFKTTKGAEEATGICYTSVSRACKGIRKSAGKHPITNEPLHWKYIYLD